MPERVFAWRGHMLTPTFARADHYFELEPLSGGVHLVHRQTYQGIVVPFIFWALHDNVRRGFELMNQALEDYVNRKKRLKLVELFGKTDWDPSYDHKALRQKR